MPRWASHERLAVTLLICGILAGFAPSLFGQDGSPKAASRDAIVQRLAKQEQLVKSCECLLTFRTDPTDPKVIPLIDARVVDQDAYITTKEAAAFYSFVAQWWRRGDRERCDRYGTLEDLAQPAAAPIEVVATDGAVVRSYRKMRVPDPTTGALIKGSIAPALSFAGLMYPSTLILDLNRTPYSQLLAHSPEVKIEEAAGLTTAHFRHPKRKDERFKLVLNRDGSVHEREILKKLRPKDREPRICERHSFSAYRSYRNAKGESVWFPSEADYDFALGTDDAGRLIIYRHVHITVKSFQFNHPIPDDVFRIHFPKDCEIWDAATGQGWVQGDP
jgi:outer membrane lipoprotein-sorting protein